MTSSFHEALETKLYQGMYDSFLDEGEVVKSSNYYSVISQKVDGTYVKRVFFPDTKTMTHYNEFSDSDLAIPNGLKKVWSDQGTLVTEGQYVNGKEEGTFKNYTYQQGLLQSEGKYKAGEREGLWKFYDKDGNLSKETKYEKGQKEGEQITYNKEGEISAKIDFRADTIYNSKILLGENPFPAKDVNEQLPMYGDGCPEKESIEEKKRCSEQKLLMKIYKNLRYPPKAREYGMQGTAYVRFIVDKTGSIKDIYVMRGLSQDISDEVLRVVNLLDTWVPGMQRGKNVDVAYTLPIRFKLE